VNNTDFEEEEDTTEIKIGGVVQAQEGVFDDDFE